MDQKKKIYLIAGIVLSAGVIIASVLFFVLHDRNKGRGNEDTTAASTEAAGSTTAEERRTDPSVPESTKEAESTSSESRSSEAAPSEPSSEPATPEESGSEAPGVRAKVTLRADRTNVAEGGAITYTAEIDPLPKSDVKVTLSNGQTIIIRAGENSGSVIVYVRANDDYRQGDETVAVWITGVSQDGGKSGIDSFAFDSTPVKTVVTDGGGNAGSNSVVSLSVDKTSVTEGASLTYTASIGSAPKSNITVSLSSGKTIIIKAGERSGSVTAPVRADDLYKQGSQTLAVKINGVTQDTGAGGLENVTFSAAEVSTVVKDNDSTSKVTLKVDAAEVKEGESVTYTADIDNVPKGLVKITLSNGKYITIKTGEKSGSITIAARKDDLYRQGKETLKVKITAIAQDTAENGLEKVVFDDTVVSTVVSDDEDAAKVTLSAGKIAAFEGTEVTFTAEIDSAPKGDLTVTLDNGKTITIEAGKKSGSTSFDLRKDDAYKQGDEKLEFKIKKVSYDNGKNGLEKISFDTKTVSISVYDDEDASKVTLGVDKEKAAEGEKLIYTAAIDYAPKSDLTVTLDNGETITIKSGKKSGKVTVSTREDDLYKQGDEKLRVKITKVTQDSAKDGLEKVTFDGIAVSTVVSDNSEDAAKVTLSVDKEKAAEGDTLTYKATIDYAPKSDITVTLDNGKKITIKSGKKSGTVTFDVREDDVYKQSEETVKAKITKVTKDSAEDGLERIEFDETAAETKVTDAETVSTVTLSVDETAVTEGLALTYTAAIDNVPKSDLTVTLDNGETITIKSGKKDGTVTFDPREDDAYIRGEEIVRVKITDVTQDSADDGLESIEFDETSADTTVSDDEDETTAAISTMNAALGEDIVFDVQLSNAPDPDCEGDTVVQVKVGDDTYDVDVDDSGAGTLTLRNDYTETVKVTAEVTGVTGGNFEAVVTGQTAVCTVNPQAISITITAEDSREWPGEEADPDSEYKYIKFIAEFSEEPEGDDAEVVFLAEEEAYSVPVNEGRAVLELDNPNLEDPYLDASSLTASIYGVIGADGEVTGIGERAVAAIVDTIDDTTVSITAADAREGEDIVFNVQLSNAPDPNFEEDTVVEVSVGETTYNVIVDADGKGTLTLSNTANDVFRNESAVTAQVIGVSGGNYENIAFTGDEEAAASVTDVVDGTKVSLSLSAASNSDNGAVTGCVITAGVDHEPQEDLVLNLSINETVTISAGELSGTMKVSGTDLEGISAVSVTGVSGYTDGNGNKVIDYSESETGFYEELDFSGAFIPVAAAAVDEAALDEAGSNAASDNEYAEISFTGYTIEGDDSASYDGQYGAVSMIDGKWTYKLLSSCVHGNGQAVGFDLVFVPVKDDADNSSQALVYVLISDDAPSFAFDDWEQTISLEVSDAAFRPDASAEQQDLRTMTIDLGDYCIPGADGLNDASFELMIHDSTETAAQVWDNGASYDVKLTRGADVNIVLGVYKADGASEDTTAFMLALSRDSETQAGTLTLTSYCPIQHADGSEETRVCNTALLTLKITLTDQDGDSADTEGPVTLIFTDDSPEVTVKQPETADTVITLREAESTTASSGFSCRDAFTARASGDDSSTSYALFWEGSPTQNLRAQVDGQAYDVSLTGDGTGSLTAYVTAVDESENPADIEIFIVTLNDITGKIDVELTGEGTIIHLGTGNTAVTLTGFYVGAVCRDQDNDTAWSDQPVRFSIVFDDAE